MGLWVCLKLWMCLLVPLMWEITSVLWFASVVPYLATAWCICVVGMSEAVGTCSGCLGLSLMWYSTSVVVCCSLRAYQFYLAFAACI